MESADLFTVLGNLWRKLSVNRLIVAASLTASLAGFGAIGTAHHVLANGLTAPGQNRPEIMMRLKGAKARPRQGNNLLSYHGGVGGVGVETGLDKVYLVYWGSQWGNNASNDPSGEAAIEQNFFSGVGGSSWNNSVTQYCQGVPV